MITEQAHGEQCQVGEQYAQLVNETRRMWAKLLLAASFGLACVHGSAQSVDDLTLITEEYPPFNYERDGVRQGIAVDLLAEMLALTGSGKVAADVKLWPWARGYETALKEKNVLLFSTVRTEAREKLFKWVGPILPARNILLAKKNRQIKIRNKAELLKSKYRIGVVRDDVAGELLARMGVNKNSTVQANTGVSVAKMLHADRVDIWAYGDQVIQWNLKQLGYPNIDFEEIYTLSDSGQYYYALSKTTDDATVARLQAALDQLRAKGRINEIVARYR